jgi:signal transduction histidine kinase
MQSPSNGRSAGRPRELIALVAGSLACVLVLAAGIASGGIPPMALPGSQPIATGALVAAGVLLAGALIWLTVVRAKREERRAVAEASGLKRSLAAADSIIRSEPQILLFWEQNQPIRVVAHTLKGIPGLPDSPEKFLRFGQWLEPSSSAALKPALDALFTSGHPFNIIVRTMAGGHVEAEGRTAGGRAVLRFRDVAGHRDEVARILAQHQRLGREVRASRALLDALPIPVWLRSKDGRLTWVNNAYVRAVEARSRAEVQERQIELLEQRQRRAAARVLARGESYRVRVPLIVGGERRPHDVTVIPFEDATAAAAVDVDVAAIEKTQGELERQAVVPYDRTLDRVTTAVAIFNAQQQLVFFNEAYRKLWQLDEDWLKTRPTEGAVLDRLRELGRLPQVVNYSEWKSKILANYGEGTAEDDTWLLPDGRTIQVLAEKRSDGGVTYLFGDETERLALERDYNALIGVQRETLDSLKEGVAVFGTDGRLKLFNSALAEIWQLSRRALAEEPHVDNFILQASADNDDQQTWTRLSRAVTSFSEQRDEFDGQMVRPDGVIIQYAVMPLPDGATLITFADVTDSKRYERALEERNDALVAGDRMKNAFISHVSYELRTPLTNIIGFSDLLGNPHIGQLNEKQHEYLGDISASSKTLLAIIDDILTLATMDAGTMELKLGQVDIPAVIDAAILGIREAAQRARLSLHIAVSDDARHLIADEARLRQILFNLLSNAVGFSKPGDTIGITCRREDGMVVFAVEDQGVGIPKDQQWKVFDRFESRSHGSTHRGAGLGLSIVKSLVELHGGTVSLESEPGQGTRVTVRLPELGRPDKAAPEALPQEGPEGPLSADGSAA